MMNLALLRVCTIMLIANGLKNLAGTLLQLFTTEPEEPFFSNYGPQILLSSICIIAVAIALVKKSPRLLKIFAVVAIIMIPIGAISYAVHFYKYLLPLGMGYHHLLEALSDFFVNPSLVADIIVMILIPIAAGTFALVKKNTLVLKIYSIIAFVYISWSTWDYVRENMFGTYYVWGAVLGMIFNPFFVVCATTFFVNPEETRLYAQKLKDLFFKWKNLA